MSDIIFHHYPQSPVSEKVRIGFGIKGLSWHSVEIPRIPPKPDLMPLTGGFRRTPVMQIGADIYCDSARIMDAIEDHKPDPTFFPSHKGRSLALCRWVEACLLDNAICVVLGHAPESLPPGFAQDRGRLYLGPNHDLGVVNRDLPHILAQIAGQLAWLDEWLASGSTYLEGDKAGQFDAFAYYILWFLRGRWPDGPAFIDRFSNLSAWERRIMEVGHGNPSELSSTAALDIAKDHTHQTQPELAQNDPQDLAIGDLVAIVPDGDGGDPPVQGELQVATFDRLAVLRRHDRVGEVCVHFPRVGYRVSKISP